MAFTQPEKMLPLQGFERAGDPFGDQNSFIAAPLRTAPTQATTHDPSAHKRVKTASQRGENDEHEPKSKHDVKTFEKTCKNACNTRNGHTNIRARHERT